MRRNIKDWQIIIPAAILLAFAAVSCSTNRHVVKQTEKTHDERSVQSDTKITTTDNTVSRVTESADTSVTVPGVKLQSESAGNMTQVVIGSDTLRATYDPVRKVTVAQYISKPRSIPVKVNKVTETKADVVQKVEQKVDSTRQTDTYTSSKDKVSKTSWLWLWLIIAAVVVLFILFGYKKLSQIYRNGIIR